MLHNCNYRSFSRMMAAFILVCVQLVVSSLLIGPVSAQSAAGTTRKALVRVEPSYPDFFRNGHFEGRIVALATVLPNGSVSSVEIKSGNPMLATYASKALMKWQYAPGPDKTVEQVIFNFATALH